MEVCSIMKKEWEAPKSIIQRFDPNEYIAACYTLVCAIPGRSATEIGDGTGTRYFNVNGMLPFENKVAEYIKQNENNHVLYRVTPIFEGENLLATGVEMEAYSIEDNGQGVCFNVFVYNVEPGITINYKTGESLQTDSYTHLTLQTILRV